MSIQKKYPGETPTRQPKWGGRGKKKIPMEYIENNSRRFQTFCKRRMGMEKRAFELAQLTGASVFFVCISDTAHIYTFGTEKFKKLTDRMKQKKFKKMIDQVKNKDKEKDGLKK